jgi:hypothetical protein
MNEAMETTACSERRYTIDKGNMTDAQYINALLRSNETLHSENRRLTGLFLREQKKQKREAFNCAKCLLKS